MHMRKKMHENSFPSAISGVYAVLSGTIFAWSIAYQPLDNHPITIRHVTVSAEGGIVVRDKYRKATEVLTKSLYGREACGELETRIFSKKCVFACLCEKNIVPLRRKWVH